MRSLRLRAQALAEHCDQRGLLTQYLQQSIDALAASGVGRLTLDEGIFRTGALFLKSGVHLELAAGATLLGSTALADYPFLPTRVAGIEMPWPAALLNVIDQEDVVLSGAGTLDGDGQVFWDSYWRLRQTYEPRGLRWAADYDAQRPRLLQILNSRRVHIEGSEAGLLLRRSGFWTLHICYSQQVSVSRLRIRNNEGGRGPSTDGIDIDSSNQVHIQHADIAVNDDALCIKAGRDADGLRVARPCSDVLIEDCIVREGAAGISMGSETSGGFRNITVRRLQVMAPVPVGILFKSAPTRGGGARQILLKDIRLSDVAVVLRITMNWNPAYSRARLPEGLSDVAPHWRVLTEPVPAERGMARLDGVRIDGLQAHGAHTAFEVDAFAQAPLQDFVLRHCAIQARRGGHILDAKDWRFEACRLQFDEDALALREPAALRGLPAGSWRHDPALARRDVSALSHEDQDIQ
jgi:hypothetical protein